MNPVQKFASFCLSSSISFHVDNFFKMVPYILNIIHSTVIAFHFRAGCKGKAVLSFYVCMFLAANVGVC